MKKVRILLLMFGVINFTYSAQSQVEPMTPIIEVESGDVFGTDNRFGVVLKSPDGNCHRIKVDNDGTVISEAVNCAHSQLPINTCVSEQESISVTDYGAMGDGVANNVEAFQNAINIAVENGVELYIPNGNYRFDFPQNNVGLIVPGPLCIRGQNIASTTLEVASSMTSYRSLFWVRNVTDVSFSHLTMTGGNIGNPSGSAIRIIIDKEGVASNLFPLPSQDMENISVVNCRFIDFRAEGWIEVFNSHHELQIKKLSIAGNQFQSRAGNAINPNSLNWNASAIRLIGSTLHPEGLIKEVYIQDNTFQAQNIKSAVLVYCGTENIKIVRNNIFSAGSSSVFQNNVGAYAIQVYDNSYIYNGDGLAPNDIIIENNNIYEPKSCGVYAASPASIRIRYNYIRGQRDTEDASLPKGAIVVAGAEKAEVSHNTLQDNYIGLSLVTPNAITSPLTSYPFETKIRHNQIDVGNNGVGVKLLLGTYPHYNVSVKDVELNALFPSSNSLLLLSSNSDNSATIQISDIKQTAFSLTPFRNLRVADFSGYPLDDSYWGTPNLLEEIFIRNNSEEVWQEQTVFY